MSEVKTVFNVNNSGQYTGNYPLFLGEQLGLYDSIKVAYPEIEELYLRQVSQNWTHTEINLEQSRMDFVSPHTKPSDIDLMVKNLALLWELDSVASRALFPMFSPFISNSELGALMCEANRIEYVHSLSYSEIIRQCVPDPNQAINEVTKNEEVLGRSDLIISAFDELFIVGAKYNLRMIPNDRELKKSVMKGVMALFLLERVQFYTSFVAIFAFAESGRFIGIGKLVSLIQKDEILHSDMSKTIFKILRKDPEWEKAFQESKPLFEEMLEEVIQREFKWGEYIFSEGRNIVGLNTQLLKEWTLWCAKDVSESLGLEMKHTPPIKEPLPWTRGWFNPSLVQVSPQESEIIEYAIDSVVNDVGEDEIFEI